MRRVGLSHGEVRKLDFIKARQLHRPEDVAPCLVQRVDAAVFYSAPLAEGMLRRSRIAFYGVVATIFVIYLPCDDAGVRAKHFRDFCNNAVAFTRIALMAEAIMAAGAELARAPCRIQCDHVGHFVDQPFRRRCSWSAEHDLEAGRVKNVNSAPQPLEIIKAGPWLQA